MAFDYCFREMCTDQAQHDEVNDPDFLLVVWVTSGLCKLD